MTTGIADANHGSVTGIDNHVTYRFGIPLQDLPRYQTKPLVEGPSEAHEGLNVELLDEIMQHVRTHPQQWNQQSWYSYVDEASGEERYFDEIETVQELNSCGTSFCFAGHVALREGFPAPPVPDFTDPDGYTSDGWERSWTDPDGTMHWEEVERFATRRLGISSGQAYVLFSGSNTMEDLEKLVALLKSNPDATPSQMQSLLSWYY